jgi:coenzyme F420-reducing hydrogenase delta subunit/NAD-dependent dihydropyrimidine dehydrogenase PreA subunit
VNLARCRARDAWTALERAFDKVFGALNPLRHLGALAFTCFAVLFLSGAYLYAALDTSLEGAWRSIERLARDQPLTGGLLRSLHRYAADAFMVLIVAHLLREWLLGRYTGFRRYSWLTGVPLLVFASVAGVGGFWLNWDRLGQFSAVATAELFDSLPTFGAAFTRTFLKSGMSDRLFSLFVFVHLGVSLLMLLGFWFHLQRIARPQVFPPRALMFGALGTLLALALAAPVTSQPPADLARATIALPLDWLLLFIHPLMYATSAGIVWVLVAGFLLLLVLVPYATRVEAAPVAHVEAEQCSGCGWCFDDCPYGAITMQPRPAGSAVLAHVEADLCASCGICVGACPAASPFRSVPELVSGIDMPQAPIGALREELGRALQRLTGEHRIVVFGCDRGARVAELADESVAAFSLICTGMLPPSFIEYALRNGATDVLITGCAVGACEFRLGQRWTEQRLHGVRQPHLRTSQRERVRLVWADRGEEARLRAQVWRDARRTWS